MKTSAEDSCDQQFGVVRAKRQRAVEVPGGLLELAAVELNAAEHDVHHRVTVVELERPVRVGVGEPPVLAEQVPVLAAPLIEIRK